MSTRVCVCVCVTCYCMMMKHMFNIEHWLNSLMFWEAEVWLELHEKTLICEKYLIPAAQSVLSVCSPQQRWQEGKIAQLLCTSIFSVVTKQSNFFNLLYAVCTIFGDIYEHMCVRHILKICIHTEFCQILGPLAASGMGQCCSIE